MFDQLVHVTGSLVVAGCRIRFRRFGHPGQPCLVLVHGGRAHSGWWAGVVPRLAPHFDLLVPDLSGFGDSGHRRAYSASIWAAEVAALITHGGRERAGVVGHSLGGKVAIMVAASRPELVERLVLVDTPVRPAATAVTHPAQPRRLRRHYPDPEAALSRFRLDPPETMADPALLRQVGAHSLTRDEAGWTWKFDPTARKRVDDREIDRALADVRCPIGIIYGEHSTFAGPATAEHIATRVGTPVPAVRVPGAYHHVPLDAPRECARAITELMRAPAR